MATVNQLIKENHNGHVTALLERCTAKGDSLFVVSDHTVPADYGRSVEYVCCAGGGHTVYRRK